MATPSWLATHFRDFVSVGLGRYVAPKLPKGYHHFFSPLEMTIIKNMWRATKNAAELTGKPLLLAGRDVWVWEVLARREGYPTTFRPDISRLTVNHVKEDYSGHFIFDTGFIGSIPKGLKSESFILASWYETEMRTGRHPITTPNHRQVFPRMTGSRSLALKIESTPKYWKSGFYREDKGIGQELSDTHDLGSLYTSSTMLSEFLRAAYLTIEIYTDSSPKFNDAPMKKSGRWQSSYFD